MIRAFVLAVITGIVFSSCVNHSIEQCHEGVIIGRIRSAGGGIAVSMKDEFFGNHEWRGHKNVIEALNIPVSLWEPGKTIFFQGRPATNDEKIYPITADGDESNKPIVMVTAVSGDGCPSN